MPRSPGQKDPDSRHNPKPQTPAVTRVRISTMLNEYTCSASSLEQWCWIIGGKNPFQALWQLSVDQRSELKAPAQHYNDSECPKELCTVPAPALSLSLSCFLSSYAVPDLRLAERLHGMHVTAGSLGLAFRLRQGRGKHMSTHACKQNRRLRCQWN